MSKKGLTNKQRTSHEMRTAGRTWEEIGTALGVSSQMAAKLAARAESNGLPALLKKFEGGEGLFKPKEREFGERGERDGAEAQFDPTVFAQMARAAGVPLKVAQALARRIEAQFGVVKEDLKKMSLAEQVVRTTEKAQMLLAHIDEVSAAGAGVKDLSIAYGVLVDKAQLLGGKPTQVFDFNLRAKLEVLMPQFLAEARRRGVTVEGQFKQVPELPAEAT